jgi:hypothetical protein
MFFRPLFIVACHSLRPLQKLCFFLLNLITFFLSLGSMPLANSLRASSGALLHPPAKLQDKPKRQHLLLTAKAVRKRQYLEPLG